MKVNFSEKLNNLFGHAEKVLSRQDFVATVRTVAVGVGHLLQLAYLSGVVIAGLVYEYIKRFVAYVVSKLGTAAGKVAKLELLSSAA